MRPIDALLDAAQHRVETSGILDTTARMGTVAAIAADGTITVTVADSTIPRVRLLRSVAPSVGATVEVLRTAGGWVCIGELATTSPAWVTPSLASPWAAFTGGGGTYQAPRFRRVGGQVEMQGVVSPSSNQTGTPTVFTLPAGYRPANWLIFPVPASGSAMRQLTIRSDGIVQYQLSSTNNIAAGAYVSVGCQFSI